MSIGTALNPSTFFGSGANSKLCDIDTYLDRNMWYKMFLVLEYNEESLKINNFNNAQLFFDV